MSTIDPIRVIRRYLFLILFSAFVGGGLGVASFFVFAKVYPLYGGEAMFEVKPALRSSTEMAALDITNDDLVFRLGKTETLFMTRRDIMHKALSSPDVTKTEWHRKYILEDTKTFSIDDALDDLEKEVRASVIRGSNYFTLTWKTHEKKDVPIIINAIARTYVNERVAVQNVVFEENLKAFRRAMADTTRDIDSLNRDINQFILDNGLTTLEDVRFTGEMKAIEEATESLSNVQTQISFVSTQYDQVSARLDGILEPSPDDIREAELEPNVQSIQRIVQDLNREVRVVEEKFGPEHTQTRELKNRQRAAELELKQTREDIIRRNLEAMKKTLDSQAEQLTATIDNLLTEIDERDKNLRDLAASQAKFEGLEERRQHLEQRRELDMQLIKEAELMKLRSDASRIQLVKHAVQPREMSFPRLEIMGPLGALVMMALTVGAIFLRELTDQRVKSASDVAVIPGSNVLGVIPEISEDPTHTDQPELVVRKHPNSVLAESYRQAQTAISRQVEHTGYQSLLLVGGLPGAGTTTVATNLASAAAAAGKRVLLIDANFRRPRLAEAMEVDGNGPGLGDVLCDAVLLNEAIVSTDNGIDLMPAGTPAHRVFERLGNARMDEMLAEVRDKYDLLIVDAPPSVVAGDAMVLASKLDSAVLVVRAGQEHRGLVARLINQFNDTRCDLLGVLLNRPRNTAGGYFKKNYLTMAEYARKSA